jgi:signal transduction histidine kinase
MEEEERSVARHVAGAELWARAQAVGPSAEGHEADGSLALVSGWEDGEPFCATICSTDVGLLFCRSCPGEVAGRVLATGRAARGQCRAGGRLLGFPAPRGSRTTAAVLRVGPPAPRDAAAVAHETRVAPAALRRAARQAPPASGRAALAAARILRDPASLFDWQVQQRMRGSDRRRTATAALAQMVATSEEFYELYREAERQRRELERNQRQLDRLARETLRASDLERARIAHQIHDTAAQSMVSAFRFLDAARAYAAGHPGQSIDAYLESASERMQAAIKEVRAVLNDLVPPGLEELGLRMAIESRMKSLAAESGLEMRIEGELPRLDDWVEQALYGMTTEALTNAVRHSRGRSVRAELRVSKGRAIVTVQDDGEGFDPEAAERRRAKGGLGLVGLAKQARWLGGATSVRSVIGSGTLVRISIPIARHAGTRAGYPGSSSAAADGARNGEGKS